MGRRLGVVVVLAQAFALLLAVGGARAAVVEHTFHVGNLVIRQLCREQVVVAVNGKVPGETIVAHEGDTVIVHVVNDSPRNLSMHWHGVFQLLSAWADGPLYVTQCPILPGQSYTYKFDVVGQEGTLWWHAHASWLRATVYGALIVLPRSGGRGYPFPQPFAEVPIMLGEWWNEDVVAVEFASLATGNVPNISNAYTINGNPGDLYPCSGQQGKL
ncbi:hypothetical protein Taro_004185 [Colocasia esculenta]|uniref:Laccase n=1 Tax=Colocasia esculenta TaxID=4460 RepID=A0A843TP98_COLES|nr:hypothetical protein [Colocasia esculenta]